VSQAAVRGRVGKVQIRYDLKVRDLLPGEEVQVAGSVLLAACATATGAGLFDLVLTPLLHVGSIKGADGSLARTIPKETYSHWFVVTNRRVMLRRYSAAGQPADTSGRAIWQVERQRVAGITKRLRLQLMARFRLEFDDGSKVAFVTRHAKTIRALQEAFEQQRHDKRRPTTNG
jgi:hypothetical protein